MGQREGWRCKGWGREESQESMTATDLQDAPWEDIGPAGDIGVCQFSVVRLQLGDGLSSECVTDLQQGIGHTT